jgi:deoxyribodipyrimidine photolyase-related protein
LEVVTKASIVFPHQLFESPVHLPAGVPVYLIEDPLFFSQYPFHKQKLLFHRSSMKAYESFLLEKGFSVKYIDYCDATTGTLMSIWSNEGIEELFLADPIDDYLLRKYKREAALLNIRLQISESPGFVCTGNYGKEYFKNKKRYFLTEFYIEQRKRLNILTTNGEPEGGKWTFDTENRKKLPKGLLPPEYRFPAEEKRTIEARQYIQNNFNHHYGNSSPLYYAATHSQAKAAMQLFFSERFSSFGIYQDAIVSDQTFLYHSVLSPLLNAGLLLPEDVIEEALNAADKYQVPINALEGFIRQIIGWREYIRIVYEQKGVQQRTRNFWNHTRPMPSSFYNGTTGIEPVDKAIQRTLETGYTHHIERLMVLGNFMLLCEIHPDAIYQWFMEMYIDSYDWVMVPNVYGMSQFADGGIMSTKPYISGSNYLLKMSDYKKGPWCEIWDALYWRFIYTHKEFFLKNPRMSMMVRQVEKMEAGRFNKLMKTAEDYLQKL